MHRVPAALRSHGLSKWWNTAVWRDERVAIIAACPQLQKSGGAKFMAGVYHSLLIELRYDYRWSLVRPIVDRLLELAPTLRAVVDRDAVYGWITEAAWRRRYNDPEALRYVITACEKRIELAPKLKAALRRRGLSGRPWHQGYTKLISLRLADGDIEGAARLRTEALAAGWVV